MNIEFDKQRVIVAGAARGIGRAMALSFAEAGAEVIACDLLVDEVAAYADEAGQGRIVPVALDVTDEAAIAALVADLDGPVSVLVYAAGGLRGEVPQPVEQVTRQSWDRIVDANMLGTFLFSKAVVPGMKAAGGGRIVVVTSGAGLKASLTGVQAYCSAKHGAVGFVKQLGLELAPFGITVNSVAPGFMLTSPDAIRQWEGWDEARQTEFRSRLVGQRLGEPQDIADAVLFLASDRASWITGQILPVSGLPT